VCDVLTFDAGHAAALAASCGTSSVANNVAWKKKNLTGKCEKSQFVTDEDEVGKLFDNLE
jgi:hypothetical protein